MGVDWGLGMGGGTPVGGTFALRGNVGLEADWAVEAGGGSKGCED